VPSNIISSIQGHAPGSVGESYGEVSLTAKDRAIRMLPLRGFGRRRVSTIPAHRLRPFKDVQTSFNGDTYSCGVQ
jgi:hypothetical protein